LIRTSRSNADPRPMKKVTKPTIMVAGTRLTTSTKPQKVLICCNYIYILPKSMDTRIILSIRDTIELKPAKLMQMKNKAHKKCPLEMLL